MFAPTMSDCDETKVMDVETSNRATRGVRPDLIGWKAIADELGVSDETAQSWERQGLIPIVSWGPTQVAAYSDRLRACAMAARLKRGKADSESDGKIRESAATKKK